MKNIAKKSFLTGLLIFSFLILLIFPISAYNAKNNLVWIVEPDLEYERIYYCGACDLFGKVRGDDVERYPNLLNVKENLVKFNLDGFAYISAGHGAWGYKSFYDEIKKVFIIYNHSEGGGRLEYYSKEDFIKNYTLYAICPIRKGDSEKIEIDNEFGGLDYTYTGDKYALMYGDEFVTDFIYEEYEVKGMPYIPPNLIDMKLGGKWGLINQKGAAITPFMFDDVEFINDNAAFVKYNGKYGVLDIQSTIFEFAKSPQTGDGGSFYIILLCISATFILFLRLEKQKIYN